MKEFTAMDKRSEYRKNESSKTQTT